MTILTIVRNDVITTKNFETISDAYNYYLKNYSTLDEWTYYYSCSNILLSEICDENIMECLFRHCFRDACIVNKG